MASAEHIVVVGGGIAGLAAAHALLPAARESSRPLRITVLETGNRWGGKILTERLDGFVIEGGPDTFLVAKPWAVKLCRELGIEDRLQGTNPNQNATYILKNGRLHPIPGGLTMMIPTEFGPMLRSRLLSWPAKLRMGADLVLPPGTPDVEESMGDFVTRRLGRAAYEALIEPLMSGIYAGDGDRLSIQATLPYLPELERKHGGLIRGALRARHERQKNGGAPGPGSRSLFLTPTSGLIEIVEALTANLERNGVDLRLQSPVRWIRRVKSDFVMELADSDTIVAQGIVLATPSYVSAELLSELDPLLAAELAAIAYVSTATVSLAFRASQIRHPLNGYGYVIPRSEGRAALACTWTSTKFPHRAPERHVLLRVFIGRAGQEGEIPWDAAGLIGLAQRELAETLGIVAEPIFARAFLWERAMPQYNRGHLDRLKRIEARLESLPALALAGNAYRGIGIPDCIHSGQLAAEGVLASLNLHSDQHPQRERVT
ncbi:MAG: protoporphyrinogen oxidase [Anaerolineae bacterium]|nr:MAG: protoporphyrinogen oxidase [Anaerolineae bacterium]